MDEMDRDASHRDEVLRGTGGLELEPRMQALLGGCVQ